MKKEDIVYLEWMYDRLRHVHKEDERVDYMRKFKRIIDNLKKRM